MPGKPSIALRPERRSSQSLDRRDTVRKTVSYIVRIDGADDRSRVPCCLENVSDGGAKLGVERPHAIPDRFVLNLAPTIARECRVRWRSATQVGVQFTDLPGRAARARDDRRGDEVLVD